CARPLYYYGSSSFAYW
nr:immunoglobulin heavy chain junction region [Mus musculus]MBK4195259.1 immunoglobulin heavy chain junction region [Mus musculus]